MTTDIDAQIISLMHAAARHGCDGYGWSLPWQQPDGDCFASDGRILVRAPVTHCLGLRIDSQFRIDGVEEIFEDWEPTNGIFWSLPKGVTGGIRPIKVGNVFLMARYVGLLKAHGVDFVIPDQRSGEPVGFLLGPLDGLIQPMEIGQEQSPGRKPWGGAK